MFNFTHVLNATTGERFYISSATLTGEGYDETPDGANWFDIDLVPESSKGIEIDGIDLIIPNDGGDVRITKNLDTAHSTIEGTDKVNAVTALIEGKTLIITNA